MSSSIPVNGLGPPVTQNHGHIRGVFPDLFKTRTFLDQYKFSRNRLRQTLILANFVYRLPSQI